MNARTFTNLITILTILIMAGCVDEVQLPARSVASRLVVEGLITNEKPPYTVKLSYTGEYNSLLYGQTDIPVSGAVVTVTEIGGKTVTLEQDPITPANFWMRDPTFTGKPGSTYQLKIQLSDGTTYLSTPERLNAVPEIERVYAEFRPRDEADINVPDHYQVLIDTKDPAGENNYYRWSGYGYVPRLSTGEPLGFGFCCNWCWIPVYGSRTEVQSDALVNGSKISRRNVLTSPIYYAGRHYVEVRQYSLTKSAYQFWLKYEEQRSRAGSLFDPLPASIEGNIYREDAPDQLALGYFGASGVSARKLIIPGDTLNPKKIEIRYGDIFVKKGNCQLVYSQGQFNPPSGW